MLYLAIDQHGKQLTVNLRDEEGKVLVQRQVSTRWAEVDAFLAQIQERSRGQGGYLAIVEVCGFNDWLLKKLAQFGAAEVVLVQAEERARQKTDRRDANRLGELLWVNRQWLQGGGRVQGLRRVVPPSEADREARQVTALRWRLGCERTRVLNRIKHLLRRHNLEQQCPTKGIQTLRARRWLKELPLGELDRWELDDLLARWQALEPQRAALEEQIRSRQGAHPGAVLLASIPGAGAYTALALACRVGDIGRFPRPRSLANYWGLTPGCRNSGEAQQRLGAITKRGSALARFLLAQLVVKVLRRDGTMRQWYKEIRRRRGSKIARVAVMRRLATIVWHILKKKEPYALAGRAPAKV